MHRIEYYLSFTLLYIIFSLIMIWLSPNKFKKKGKVGMALVGAILIFVCSIRMNTGSDYWAYSVIYNRSFDSYYNLVEVYEEQGNSPGFYVLSYFLKELTINLGWESPLENNLIFIVTAIFVTITTFYLIIKDSFDIKWSMWVFFLMGYFLIGTNILKQIFAMIILMFAYDYLFKKKYVVYGGLCVLAVLFHVTALVPALLFPFADRIKLKVVIWPCLLMAIILPILGEYAANVSLFGYVKYFKHFSIYSDAEIGKFYSIGCLAAYSALYITLKKYSKRIREVSPKTYSYINLLAVGIAINAVAINFWLILRISLYFYQFSLFLIPNAIRIINPSQNKTRTIKVYFILFAIFYVLFSMDNHYFAYHTIYEDMEPVNLYDYVDKYEKLK